jgi:hypothetical protein
MRTWPVADGREDDCGQSWNTALEAFPFEFA